MGRWSRLVAREFITWLRVAPGARWLDIGCGTGGLTETILQLADPLQVVGIDPSHAYVGFAQAHIKDSRATLQIGDAQQLPDGLDGFDAVVSGLVLNFIPDQERALAEMRRAVRPGGTIAGYVWDYAGQMELMRYFWDAAADLNPDARELDEGRRFPTCRPNALAVLFSKYLVDVAVADLVVPTVFRDFDDYWSPFLGGQGPAPGYAMSLDDERRGHLRELIRARLPTAQDGSIPLKARAWAARGRRLT
jgi:SAM-dependent methyltransferase